MAKITMSSMFKTPKSKKAKKMSMCTPNLPYSVCTNAEKRDHCNFVHGKKRQYCRTKKNKARKTKTHML
jgi:hypothetical protein